MKLNSVRTRSNDVIDHCDYHCSIKMVLIHRVAHLEISDIFVRHVLDHAHGVNSNVGSNFYKFLHSIANIIINLQVGCIGLEVGVIASKGESLNLRYLHCIKLLLHISS